VPIVYSYLRKSPPVNHDKQIEEEEREPIPGIDPWDRIGHVN